MNKINLQSGRSMIEMLGVLAIIGVLSVGGIMGYSKAMHRYRVNKTIEIMSKVFHNFDVITSTKIVGDKLELYDAEEMIKYGFIDKEDCGTIGADKYGDTVCELPIGQLGWGMWFSATPQNDWGNPNKFRGEFYLDFTGANKVEQCIDFASHDWLSIIPRKWWMPNGVIIVFPDTGETPIYDYSGYYDLEPDTKPTLEQIVDACGKCEGSNRCLWYVAFAGEL